ncbi:hypothetical protein BC834DRAFT_856906 [Gloeopeniophorella convolvens]|nr:hypothetical protein BC834DRAFT_856906 [Gloeopeniophorella convolvens]
MITCCLCTHPGELPCTFVAQVATCESLTGVELLNRSKSLLDFNDALSRHHNYGYGSQKKTYNHLSQVRGSKRPGATSHSESRIRLGFLGHSESGRPDRPRQVQRYVFESVYAGRTLMAVVVASEEPLHLQVNRLEASHCHVPRTGGGRYRP